MSQPQPSGEAVYTCPMHKNVRQTGPGKCPQCGMSLIPEGARFGMLRHMLSSPMHRVAMGAVMLAIMAAVMIMMVWK